MKDNYMVLVCGGRAYNDAATVSRVLGGINDIRRITHLITGGASGADSLAADWAIYRGIQPVTCRANWLVHKQAAGPIRNRHMADLRPDVVVAFPGQRGTASMVEIAKARNIVVHEVK